MIETRGNQIKSLGMTGCLLMALMMFVGMASAQGWERTFGGASEDYGEAVVATSDWGGLVVGYSESFGADKDLDVYAVRLDVDGNVLWTQTYDEAFEEHAYNVIETADGGFLIVGDIVNRPGEKANAYLLKINANGLREWSYQYGSPDSIETIKAIAPGVDGGFLLAGSSAPSNESTSDVFLVKVADNGRFLWSKRYGGLRNEDATDVAPYKGGYVVTGSVDNSDGSVGRNILLYRLGAGGQTIWTKSIGDNTTSGEGEDVLITRNNQIVVAGRVTTTTLQAFIARFDENGEEIWSRKISKGLEDDFKGVVELSDGSLVAAGLSSIDVVNVDLFIVKLDAGGQILWMNNQGRTETYEAAEDIASTADGGFLMVGYNGKVSGLFNDLIVVKTDGLGNTFSSTVSGKIFFDRDGLCDEDINDDPIEGWLVKVESSDKIYFGTSDAQGRYRVQVDTGAYKVSVLLPTNLWRTCTGEGYDVQFENLYDGAELDFPVSVEKECPYLEVNVSALTIMTCEEGDYSLEYRNAGTAAAQNVRLEVTLDESLTVKSATAAYQVVNGKLVFLLGNLLPFKGGKISLTVSNCDGGELQDNEAVMVKAKIMSDVFCSNAGPTWDGSSVEVSGICDQDTISFIISNESDNDMTEKRQYGVVEDIVLIKQDSFRLKARQSIRVFWKRATGSTYRIIAEQVKDHPGSLFPTFALEGCTTEDNPTTFTTGYVTMFPENDGDPNLSIDVQEAVSGSVPEVEMRGYPKGYKENKIITGNTDLTYKISFNNYGADTITRVVIRDTLPPELDITTLVPGASSHPYTFEVYDQGILKITFPDISLLPGGNANSGGFVNFRLSQKPGNPVGTVIRNSAAIFLGYRGPVQTNVVFHEVGNFPDFLDVKVNVNQIFVPGVKIKVSPNPFIESTTVEIEGKAYTELTFSVYDLQGKLLRRERYNSNKFEIYRNNLTAGMYLYTISSKEQIINTGKILVQ